MKVKFVIVVKRGNRTLTTVQGTHIEADAATLADVAQIIPTEQYLERLTGLRFHINCEPVDEPR